MSEPFLGEMKLISWNFPPKGWAFCNGQLLPINQNQALFSLLGTTYGGNGQTNFALPNMQGRAPIHIGEGWLQGQASGEAAHTLVNGEMPTHTHMVQGSSATALARTAAANTWGTNSANPYNSTSNTTMAPGSVSVVGGSQPHENRQPYLVLNMVIALQGIFPSQN
jgi:microcystin-dependent protein